MRVSALLALLLSMVVSAQEIDPPNLDKWVDNAVKPIAPGDGRVLVLGSGGLIGRSVVILLQERGYDVAEVANRTHLDLRAPGALDRFNGTDVRYCIFLACEVGGSKFIESSEMDVQLGIIESNIRIYQTVFPWLIDHRIPFAFTSSYLQGTENGYGSIKRLGEAWVRGVGDLGRVLRLWNVYGAEAIGQKSHVLSDWSEMCIRGEGDVLSRTDGKEERQFVYVGDTAMALVVAMERHWSIDMVSDVSSGVWVTMREAAAALSSVSSSSLKRTCKVVFDENRPAAHRDRLGASLDQRLHRFWTPQVTLSKGISFVLEDYLSPGGAGYTAGSGLESKSEL